MSDYYEEAAMAHGAGNPWWEATFQEGFTGREVVVTVRAATHQEAINKATDRLNLDLSKPEGAYFFRRCEEKREAEAEADGGPQYEAPGLY